MRRTTRRTWAAVATAGLLVAAGCTSAPADDPGGGSGGVLRIAETEPSFLTPSGGNDEPSIHVVRQLYRGLVQYGETGAAELDLAESITSDDQTVWTVTLQPGYTFTNGEPVDADAFIRAWNYTAYGPNTQRNGSFMSRIVGFDDLQAAEDGSEPSATELAGLTKVDDRTFTVELAEPFAGFPAMVGYSGFFPMAEACLEDVDACNEVPIGNGPYKIDGRWEHNVGITLVRNDDFAGEPGKADRLEYRIFADTDGEYAAFQAGEIDIVHTIPAARYQQAKATYGDHLFEIEGNSFTYIGMPVYHPLFQNTLIRQALSLSLDRQAIIDAVFDGRFTPATGFVAPTFEGARAGVCGYCEYDVERAAELLEDAGGWPGGPLVLWANAGAGHEIWLQAVGDQIKDALGIDYEIRANLDFDAYLTVAGEHQFTGPYRLGWGPDYGFIETFLTPLYFTDSSSNYSGYANPDFDDLIRQADGATSVAEAISLYQEAEDILGEDLPVIPMWFNRETVLFSENVDELVWNVISDVDYHKVTVKPSA